MDKQQTQYQLIPKWKWKMLTNYWKFPNRSVQTFGCVYHDTNGQNHGPVWKTQSFFFKGIWTVIFWQDCFGKRQFEKILLKYGWEKIQNWECLFVHREKRIIIICVRGWHKIGWKETKSWSDVESTKQRSRFGRTNIFPWSCFLGLHSKTMWKKQRYCWQLQNHVWIANFRGWNWRTSIPSKSSFLHGLMIWKVMRRNVWSDIVSWQTRRLNNSTQYLLHGSITTTLKKKWNLLENCHKYHLKLFWTDFNWHVLDDLIFYGQWTNLHDQSQNGPKPVANAWTDWYLNNAGWDCFNTPILQRILRTKNPLLEEHYVLSEVKHLFQ